MGRLRERAALTIGAALLGVSVAGVIARKPFRRLIDAARRRRSPPPAGPGSGPPGAEARAARGEAASPEP